MDQYEKRVLGMVNAAHQFSHESGVEVTHLEPGLVQGVLRAGPNSINPEGNIHGGAIATLADTVAGCCACSTGGDCVTSSCSIEYLRPAVGDLYCEATPKKLGRSLSVIGLEITDTRGKLVATGTFTFFMTQPGDKIN